MNPYVIIALRYSITAASAMLAVSGVLSDEQATFISGNVDMIVGIIGMIAPLSISFWVRSNQPSEKAMNAARAIDEKVPADKPVVIKTPVGTPDIIVQPVK